MKLFTTRIWIYFFLLIAAVSAMVSLRRCGTGQIAQSETDTIRVCIEYSPLSCYMYDDTLGGFEYDLLRAMAHRCGVAMQFIPAVSLTQSIDGLESGKYDVLAAQIPATADMKKRFSFSEPVYLDRQVLVQCQDTVTGEVPIKSILDLANDTVWVIKDSPMEHRIRSLSQEIGDTIYVREEAEYGSEQLLILVAKGRVKYAVMNESTAKAFASGYPQIDISKNIGFTQFQSWTLRKDDTAMCDSINHWLQAVKSTGEYDAIYKRYFK